MTDSLTKLDQATRMLAEVRSIDDAKDLINLAEAARVYAKKVGLGLEDQNHAAEIKIRTQRKAGEILDKMEKAKGAQGIGPDPLRLQAATAIQPPTYAELDIDKRDAHTWQTIAAIPDEIFESVIAEIKDADKELTTTAVYNVGRDYIKACKRSQSAQASGITPDGIAVIDGDFRDVMTLLPDSSIDMIFTDPPYDEETIPLYGDMAQLAARVLKPGGSLITYVGHYSIGEIYKLMEPHLRYWWTIALDQNGTSARLPGKWVFVDWKPLMWWVKERRSNNEYVADKFVSTGAPSKADHDWQQSTGEASYYISKLTKPGDTILDPFCGSGTTLIAAYQNGRNAIGIELDQQRADVARNRIERETCK